MTAGAAQKVAHSKLVLLRDVVVVHKVAALLKRDGGAVGLARRQRQVKTRVLAMCARHLAMVIRRHQVARKKPRSRRDEVDQVLDVLVSAGCRLARCVQVVMIHHQTQLAR